MSRIEHCPELASKLTYIEARELVTEKTYQGARNDLGNLPKSMQSERAKQNEVSPRTQKKLDKLAGSRPDLLDRVRKGELSATRACIEAGWGRNRGDNIATTPIRDRSATYFTARIARDRPDILARVGVDLVLLDLHL